MNELDLACNLMEQRAASGRSAKAVVSIIPKTLSFHLNFDKTFDPLPQPILRRLRDKARIILTQLSQGAIDKASPQSNSNSSGRDDDHDELAIFAGRTRFISSGQRSRSPTGSPQAVGSIVSSGSPRRRGSESVGTGLPHNGARRGSESFRYSQVPQSESDIYRQAHPSLLEYMRGINGYVPPPAMIQGLMAARADEAREPSPLRSVIKSDMSSQTSFGWVDPSVTASSSSTATPGGSVFPPFSNTERQPEQHPLDLIQDNVSLQQAGVYVTGGLTNPMAQAVGTFGYPGELNGDGTWQQLMVQLGVMEGQH